MSTKENTDRYKKKWTEEDAVKVQLLTRLHSERKTEELTGIPHQSVHRLKDKDLSPRGCEALKRTEVDVIKGLDRLRDRLMEQADTMDLRKATVQQILTSIAISIDKSRLLAGEPTELLGIMGLLGKPDNELERILEGDVEITDATPTSDNKHNVSLSQEEGHKGPKISNSEADDIE